MTNTDILHIVKIEDFEFQPFTRFSRVKNQMKENGPFQGIRPIEPKSTGSTQLYSHFAWKNTNCQFTVTTMDSQHRWFVTTC